MYLDQHAERIGWGFATKATQAGGEITPEELLEANRDKVEALIEHAKEAEKWRKENE